MLDISKIEAQLRATLNVIPAYTWYALPSGALTFVNERTADYLGLPKDHPLRFGTEWDSHIVVLHPDDHGKTRRVWSTCLRTGSAAEVIFRVRNFQRRRNAEATIFSRLVSDSASTPSVAHVPGDSLRSVADSIGSLVPCRLRLKAEGPRSTVSGMPRRHRDIPVS